MPKPPDLELLRSLFNDDSIHIGVAVIERVTIAQDRSVLFARIRLVPDGTKMVARMSWESVGPDSGFFQFPQIDDLVLIGMAEGNEDQVYVLKRLSSKVDKIPVQALDGSTVMKALAGKKAHLLSDTAIFLGRGGADPTERLVLGDTFKDAYSEHLGIDATHTHIDSMGYPTLPPEQASDYTDLQASPVDDEAILSDISKTEK